MPGAIKIQACKRGREKWSSTSPKHADIYLPKSGMKLDEGHITDKRPNAGPKRD
jgi:hypothetical protein